jgi:hypothetical protein
MCATSPLDCEQIPGSSRRVAHLEVEVEVGDPEGRRGQEPAMVGTTPSCPCSVRSHAFSAAWRGTMGCKHLVPSPSRHRCAYNCELVDPLSCLRLDLTLVIKISSSSIDTFTGENLFSLLLVEP